MERDLNELSCLFPLETSVGSPPIGWRWREDAVQDLPGLDLIEALSLSLVGDLLSQTLPPSLHQSVSGRINEAKRKLQALPSTTVAGWSQLARYLPPGMPLLAPEVSPEILDCVEECLVNQQQLVAQYQSADCDSPQEFRLHPVALISHGATPYLLASFGPDKELWQYPLHRFHSAENAQTPSWRPKGFDLDHYITSGQATFGKTKKIRLEARIEKSLANILRETPLSEDQSITDRKDYFLLRATVQYSWELVFYILSQGSRITITKPKALKSEIVSGLQAALSNYETV